MRVFFRQNRQMQVINAVFAHKRLVALRIIVRFAYMLATQRRVTLPFEWSTLANGQCVIVMVSQAVNS